VTDQTSNNWPQKVETALIKSQQLPSLEEGFPFPWEKASLALESALGMKGFKLSTRPSSFKMAEEILSGMGNEPVIFNIELAPIPESVQWIMSSEDIETLTAHCLSSDHKSEGFSDHKLQEGFYQFLLLEAMQAIDQLKVFKDGALRLLPASTPSKEGAICVDVAIAVSTKTLYGRLVCPQSFMNAFKAHQPFQNTSFISEDATKQLEVSLHLEAGSVALSPEEWKNVMPGDFVILDHCSYDPDIQKGSVTLMLGDTPLLRGRIKPEGVKILEYAFYFEDKQPIETTTPAASGEENFAEEPLSEEEAHLWSTSAEEEMETAIQPQQTPIVLSVEVGYIRMTIGKLLDLKPDTMLDLSIRPEQGVDATINGKRIAKGELIKLGQILGLRLLDIER